jgi:recombination protein RecR
MAKQYNSLVTRMIDALKLLPGVGQKSAQRMAFYLLKGDSAKMLHIADTLRDAVEKLRHCSQCRNYTEHNLCELCSDTQRHHELLCVVENPSDLLAVENGTNYRGHYFVLMGRLSPLDGIGPEQLGLGLLEQRLNDGKVKEVILATNPTVEGEVTAHVIAEMAKKAGLSTTRLAQGMPVGGELEYVDLHTLARAFDGRTSY